MCHFGDFLPSCTKTSILRKKENVMRKLIRYIICGLFTTLASLKSYATAAVVLGTDSTFRLQACNVISWALAVILAFFVSRTWVFRSKNEHIWKEFFAFTNCRILTLLCDMAIMQVLVIGFHVHDLAAKLVVQVVVTVLNYVFGKLVFRRSSDE